MELSSLTEVNKEPNNYFSQEENDRNVIESSNGHSENSRAKPLELATRSKEDKRYNKRVHKEKNPSHQQHISGQDIHKVKKREATFSKQRQRGPFNTKE
ncbi:31994_t:CDS:2 [Gigaspora margarita]|uniref:31994_t:CDS:1 n=1 Tax=Gigaspora margarita TaxID=4874 RepID=A0ABM8W617_GIGMA|nr:31994_t:CDS:2 [Gigaspora margarita]